MVWAACPVLYVVAWLAQLASVLLAHFHGMWGLDDWCGCLMTEAKGVSQNLFRTSWLYHKTHRQEGINLNEWFIWHLPKDWEELLMEGRRSGRGPLRSELAVWNLWVEASASLFYRWTFAGHGLNPISRLASLKVPFKLVVLYLPVLDSRSCQQKTGQFQKTAMTVRAHPAATNTIHRYLLYSATSFQVGY